MTAHDKFRGTGVAIVTPFRSYELDLGAMTRMIEHVIKGGVEYIVALGSTGESATLTESERRKVLDHVIGTVDKRVPVVAGNFGHNDTRALCSYIEQFNFDGIDGVLSSSPHYVKPTQQGIFEHYKAVSVVCPVPIILYNVPGRTASNVLPETVVRIARECPSVVAVKEASADQAQVSYIIKHAPKGFLTLSGDDPTALHTILAGGKGVISVIANAFPRQFSDMVRAAMQGDNQKAIALNSLLLDVHPHLYREGNPTGIKAAVEILGLATREVRLPLTPMTESNFRLLKDEMNKVNAI